MSAVNSEKKSKRRPLPKSLNEIKTQIALGTLTDEDKIRLARSKKTSSDVLEMLSTSLCEDKWEEIQKLEAIADNLNTSPETLRVLYNPFERAKALKHPNFPADLLQEVCNKIIYDSVYKIHYAAIFQAIKNPTLSADILKRLSCHPNIIVKDMVAEHLNTPPDVLEALSTITLPNNYYNYPNYKPPRSVALNQATPTYILTTLAKSKSLGVRRAVASNPSTPIPVLKELTTKSKGIRGAALNTLYTLGKIKIV